MIAAFTRFFPNREHFDEVLERAVVMARDEEKCRVGCLETRLFCDRDGGEITTVSLWESMEILEEYLVKVTSDGSLMEFQSHYLRREIDTNVYETVDLGANAQLPKETELQRRFGT